MRYLVFDVGGTAIKHAVIDEAYRLGERGLIPTAGLTSSAQFVETLAGVHDGLTARVDGIALSTCGELDPVTGHVYSGGSLQFNNGANLVTLLQARCGTRVTVENDANCALLAEFHDGVLVGCTNAAVFVIGTGVGGALLLGGRIHHGSHFHAGNASFTLTSLDVGYAWAHLLGVVGGVGALTGAVAAAKGVGPATLDGRAVFDLVEAGDPDAVTALGEFSTRLARFIYNAQVLLDVEVVALGGGISARAAFVDAVAAEVDALFDAAFVPLPRPRVLAARHRNDANLLGALYHYLHSATD